MVKVMMIVMLMMMMIVMMIIIVMMLMLISHILFLLLSFYVLLRLHTQIETVEYLSNLLSLTVVIFKLHDQIYVNIFID